MGCFSTSPPPKKIVTWETIRVRDTRSGHQVTVLEKTQNCFISAQSQISVPIQSSDCAHFRPRVIAEGDHQALEARALRNKKVPIIWHDDVMQINEFALHRPNR